MNEQEIPKKNTKLTFQHLIHTSVYIKYCV